MTKDMKLGFVLWVILGFGVGMSMAGMAIALVILPWFLIVGVTFVGMGMIALWRIENE